MSDEIHNSNQESSPDNQVPESKRLHGDNPLQTACSDAVDEAEIHSHLCTVLLAENCSLTLTVILMLAGMWASYTDPDGLNALQIQLQKFLGSQLSWLDQGILQLIGAAALIAPLSIWAQNDRQRWKQAFFAALLIVAVMLSFTFLKNGFAESVRPLPNPSNEGLLTGKFRHIVSLAFSSYATTDKVDAPSASVARQTVLFMSFILLALHPRVLGKWHWNALVSTFSWLIAVLSFLTIIFMRFASGAHTPFAVATGLGVGVLGFWFLWIGLRIIVGFRATETIQSYLLWALLFCCLFVLYSGSFIFWSTAWLLLLFIGSLLAILDERAATPGGIYCE